MANHFHRFCGLLFVLWSLGTQAQSIDPSKSYISFEIGNMLVNTVHGKISGMEGTVNFDAAEPESASFDVCVDPATVDTDNHERDDHLKNPDFFDVEKYPSICFVSSSVAQTDDGFITKGKLTINGHTNEVTIPFTRDGQTLKGQFELDRFDYQLGAKAYDGTFAVDDDVEVEIVCVLK